MTTKTELKKVSESNVQKAICDLLAAKKILHFRMNAGDRLMQSGGKTYRIRGHEKGTADLLAIVPGGSFFFQNLNGIHDERSFWAKDMLALWIEVKAPGKKQRPEQEDFEERMIAYGCCYLLADSVDTVMDWLKERGL